MDEYTLEVNIEGHKEEIKSYSNSIHHVVDAMVNLNTIVSISKITRTRDKQVWNFDDASLDKLRELRNEIQNEALIYEQLEKVKET
tara:strand:+ start:248 stop:505 length:258 start_codon:yes stop_codon:yes gene_type:complete